MLRAAFIAGLFFAAAAPFPALAQDAGVTAAVNQSARGIPPGGSVRTIVLGANIVQNETIETNAVGLVQILLADGTTFTVGPNSSLSIDRFVYDPAANTAQVTASVTRGVFRFIGGRTSKTEDGVNINTPVGTVGIRGAVVNFSVGGSTGTHFDLIFGKEVTLIGAGGIIERLYRPGYSIGIGAGGTPNVLRTPPDWTNVIQQALTAKPGTSGGSNQQPTNQTVQQSGVAKTNSEVIVTAGIPTGPIDTSAIQQLQQLTPTDIHQIAQQIIDGQDPPGPGEPTFDGTFSGFATGIVVTLDSNNDPIPQVLWNTDPEGVEVEFNPQAGTFGGSFALFAPFTGAPVLNAEIAFGSATSGGTSYFTSDEIYFATGDGTAITANINGVGEVTGTPGQGGATVAGIIDGTIEEFALCECDFMQWGVWIAEIPGNDNIQNGMDTFGLWVTGDKTTGGAFDTYADTVPAGMLATYNGSAVGLVTEIGSPSWEAVFGDMQLTYDFGERDGSMSITDFDGRDFLGMDIAGGPLFEGQGVSEGILHDINGHFVTDGSDVAGGVVGNFILQDEQGWQATGVFGGSR
jgi:hypothetical protein